MTGRELYERLCVLQFQVPDWWRLGERQRQAWDDLAGEVLALSSTEEGR